MYKINEAPLEPQLEEWLALEPNHKMITLIYNRKEVFTIEVWVKMYSEKYCYAGYSLSCLRHFLLLRTQSTDKLIGQLRAAEELPCQRTLEACASPRASGCELRTGEYLFKPETQTKACLVEGRN